LHLLQADSSLLLFDRECLHFSSNKTNTMWKRYSLFCIIVTFSFNCFGQALSCDTIYWSENTKLKWTDFRGKPDTTVSFKAISSLAITYKLQLHADSLTIDVFCSFRTCNAWTKSNTLNLLKHEQTHFDISQYFKLVFIQRLLTAHYTKNNAIDQVKNIWAEIKKERDDLNITYDKESDLSRNNAAQIRWTTEINSRINRLKNEDKTRLIFFLKE
jgi:hypothetical protein